MKSLGLQLYSVKNEMEKDVFKTLERVRKLGIEYVEFAGFFGVPAKEMKEMLDTLGLKAVASHTGMDLLEGDLEGVIEYNKIIGNSNIVCPHYPLKDQESVYQLAEKMKKIIPRLNEAGMTAFYHNHAHEFFPVEGGFGLELLFREIPELYAEIDTYWVNYAGLDAAKFCIKHRDRCRLVHLKDGTKSGPTPIGEGDMDIGKILETAKFINAEYVFIEDETFTPSGLECVEKGLENLKKIIM